ncbi:MAG TPA: efflux RND transporter permease subunit [Ktedonobacterales bacterium]
MRQIIEQCLRLRLVVVGIAAVLLVIGIAQLRATPVDALPEFSQPTVEVQTEALGLSASEVEELITLNLEELLSNTPFLQSLHSSSVPGLSSITLTFEPGTDVLRARQLVSEKLSLAFALPNVSKPPTILPLKSATSRVMMIGLSSKQVSAIQLSVLARWTIQPALLSVPGVANVAIWGMRDYQLQVLVDPQRLKDKHVTLDQVISTTGNALWVSPLTFLNASAPGTGGFIDSPQQRLEVRHVFPISRPQDLDKVIVEGTNLRLSDVATVVEDHQPLIGDDLLNGDSGLVLVIDKLPGTSTQEVTDRVEARLQELQPGLSGIQINSTVYRPASFMDSAMNNLSIVLLISALLVLGLLLLYQWRIALISLVAIPLSLVAAGVVLSLTGSTINVMVLAGLVLASGVLIDDVIVDMQNVFQRFQQYRQEGRDDSTTRIIAEAILEMRRPMLYATLIMLLVVLPVLLLSGPTGAFFRPLVVSYALALLASMLVALVVTPPLCLLLLSRAPATRRESPILRAIQRNYTGALGRMLRTPLPAFTASGVLLLFGILTLPFLQQSLIPTFKEHDVVIQWDGPPGTGYPEMARITTLASRELRTIHGVRSVGALIGRAVLGDQIVDVNSAQLIVGIAPTADYDSTVAAVQRVIRSYPGIHHVMQTYLNTTIAQTLPSSSDQIVVRIYGNDLATLRRKAEEMRRSLAQIDGAANVRTEAQVDVPHIQVSVNLDKAQRYGLKPGDIRRIASTFVAGLEAGNLFEVQKVFSVVVMGTPDTRTSLTSVENLLIDTPGGGHVRLGDVASVSIGSTPDLIQHDAVSRRVDVSLAVQGRDRSAVLHDVEQRIQQMSMPDEFHAEVLGDYDVQQADRIRLLVSALAAAVVVFLLLQAAFGNWRLAAMAFLTLPLATVGGLLMILVSGGIVELGSLLGLLAVFALAVRNCLALITHYQHLKRYEGESFGLGLVMRGAQERLTPILLTALAVGLSMLPLAIAGDIPGLEIGHPMALVILGGLVTSTILTVFIIPALYLRFGSSARVAGSEPVTISMEGQPDAAH